jgi:DNA-binding transcriptional LysR family regulator
VDIRDLEYFLACCRADSFTAAAREVHIVQSAMSSAIGRLEQDLGVPLFDRTSTRVTLTEHGSALQTSAQRVLDAVQATKDDVAAVSGQVRGRVTLGSTLHTGPLKLAGVLADIRESHPQVVVQLRQSKGGSAGKMEAVRDGSVDIALIATSPTDKLPRGVEVQHLLSEPLVFVCGPDHPLSERQKVTVADLKREMILRFPPGWGSRAVIDSVLGMTESAFEIADYGLMYELVQGGFGTTLVPASAVRGEFVSGLRALRVDDPRLCWDLAAAVSTERRLTAAATVLLGALIKRSGIPSAMPASSQDRQQMPLAPAC